MSSFPPADSAGMALFPGMTRLTPELVRSIGMLTIALYLLPSAQAQNGSSMLQPGQQLTTNQRLTTANGRGQLIMQGDGNLVLYALAGPALWATNTWGTPANHAIMQQDGNFVLYDSAGRAYWSTNTWGHSGAYLAFLENGDLVVYSATNSVLWSSQTTQSWGNTDRLSANQQLNVSDKLVSPNGNTNLIMQSDGNLVLYPASGPALWASGTSGTVADHAIMQWDGNFVVYDATGHAYWSTNTWGHPGSYIEMQNDGNLVVFSPTNVPLWASNTQAANLPSLTGWFDLHTHPLGYLGFGGKLIYGGVDIGSMLPPVSPPPFASCNTTTVAGSETDALSDENQVHGGYGFDNACGDTVRDLVIHVLNQQLGAADWPDSSYKVSGFRNFPTWPAWNDVVNQKMWVEWIRRSYQGGQRVMVALAVNNKLLGDMTRGPGDLPSDDAASGDLQIEQIKEFVGRHSDFMQIAYNSSELYSIVSQNKLAVIIGVELDNIGNLKGNQPGAALVSEVDRLYNEGVRYIFPVHLVDNPIGGAAAYEDLFNVANVYEEGNGYALACSAPADNITYQYTPPSPLIAAGAFVKLGTNTPWTPRAIGCPPGVGNVNTKTLTPSGVQAIREMMRKGMLIDVDHMSEATVNATIALVEGERGAYPLNSGHNGVRGALGGVTKERSLTAAQYQQIGLLHGMAGVGSAQLDAQEWLMLYSNVIQHMGPGAVGGFGTDMDGMEFAMKPRAGSSVQYGTPAFPMQKSSDGNQSWDYNQAGVAHYGMLPDFLQDVASLPGGSAAISNMNGGAQYFYDTWRMSERGCVFTSFQCAP
jgi:microsomal dipeptidase-like Zn-dependent dipeptidase